MAVSTVDRTQRPLVGTHPTADLNGIDYSINSLQVSDTTFEFQSPQPEAGLHEVSLLVSEEHNMI